MSTTDQKEIKCFFCGRDLSQANKVNYVAEGPICSMCLINTKNQKYQKENNDLDQFDQVILE